MVVCGEQSLQLCLFKRTLKELSGVKRLEIASSSL